MSDDYKKISAVHYNRELKKLGAYYIRYMQQHTDTFNRLGYVVRDWESDFVKTHKRHGENVVVTETLKEQFTSHLGRRTGVTFYLSVKSLSTVQAMKYSGHKTVDQLLTYEHMAESLVGKYFPEWIAFDQDGRFVIPKTAGMQVAV